jgi:hypothetical protein
VKDEKEDIEEDRKRDGRSDRQIRKQGGEEKE